MKITPGHPLVALSALALSAAAPSPLTGEWGGDRVRLVLNAKGGQLSSDCASGTITGPVRIDARSRFKAKGDHEEYAAGPQLAEGAQHRHAATYRGSINGDTMTLIMQVEGNPRPQSFTLVRGKRTKLFRCL